MTKVNHSIRHENGASAAEEIQVTDKPLIVEGDLGMDREHVQLARNLSKKLRSDIAKAIEHFVTLADIAEFDSGEKITVIIAVLERLLIETGLSRETLLLTMDSIYTEIKNQESKKK